MQIPGNAMHATARREQCRRSRPVEGKPTLGRRRCLLAKAIVRGRVEGGMRTEQGIVARVGSNDFAAVLEDLELHLTRRVVRQVVVDDTARWRILARSKLRRPRR